MEPIHNASAHERAHMPEGTDRILNTRSLASSNRQLAALLQPGLDVLDAGCGTGAITYGIAEVVGPEGQVVGIDANQGLIEQARLSYQAISNLSFNVADIYDLTDEARFDVATAARVLQWLATPQSALVEMTRSLKTGGRLLILDYNHEKIQWTPQPPAEWLTFYEVFLRWRAESGMDNAIADHLSGMFENIGLRHIEATPQHEITHRKDDDFSIRIGIWAEVAAMRGPQMVRDGYVTEEERALAETSYRTWVSDEAESQTMYLLAVTGVKPTTCTKI